MAEHDEVLSGTRRLWARLAARVIRMRSDIALAAVDAALVASGFVGMLLLRFDGSIPSSYWDGFLRFLPWAAGVVVVSNGVWGLYGQLWRHASLYEARRLVLSGITAVSVLMTIQFGARDIPLSVVFTGTVAATFLTALVRFQSRLFSFHRAGTGPGMGVVVIGAGDAGASLVADMIRSPRAGFRPVSVLDEDTRRHGRAFMGVRIDGGIGDLRRVVEATDANLVVFAMTNAPQELVRRAASAAESAEVPMKIVPGIATSMRGGASLRDLRDLRIEDLLGRDQISTDLDAVRAMLVGRRVLITGAGGSIGSEISRQVAACDPASLVMLDHDETHLHDATAMLEGPIHVVLADIRNRRSVNRIFAEHRPEVVFHAAALKHVPVLEAHPGEAVKTNVIGTSNILDAAREVGVSRLVFISTDKAVYPSSVMGASKRLGEQLVLNRAPGQAAYCAVRFGNVLGSRGSVVPTFMRQIDAGGPVTVTDRRMTRFFMSIEEAVQLVLQAAALADPDSGGEVFMLDMGEPVVIHDLAERMIRLSGRRPGDDIEIRITGIRPGEKLVEELTALDELEAPTLHPSIRRVSPIAIDSDMLEQGVLELEHFAGELDDVRCATRLADLASVDAHDPPVSTDLH